jgi:hypothetical protein
MTADEKVGRKNSWRRWLLFGAAAVLLVAAVVGVVWWQGWLLQLGHLKTMPRTATPSGQMLTITLPADGRTHAATVLGLPGFGRRDWSAVVVRSENGAALVPVAGNDGKRARLMVTAPVMPGEAISGESKSGESRVQVLQPNFLHYRKHIFRLLFTASDADSFGDGTPDYLRLHTAEDRAAFRAWFTLMADSLYDRDQSALPAGVTDCAGLLRYAYREALLRHDDKWFADERAAGMMTVMPPLGEVRQYHYPETPLGADLFRVRAGKFALSDEKDGAFAQFADAKTLMMENAHLIGRDIHMAKAGDLIFYRQLGQNSPYHSMIIIKDTGSDAESVVYHTGPVGRERGEVRRMTMADLLNHPDARWRPVAGNPNFLGVYRWNILREDD